jgi:hypothetical protein
MRDSVRKVSAHSELWIVKEGSQLTSTRSRSLLLTFLNPNISRHLKDHDGEGEGAWFHKFKNLISWPLPESQRIKRGLGRRSFLPTTRYGATIRVKVQQCQTKGPRSKPNSQKSLSLRNSLFLFLHSTYRVVTEILSCLIECRYAKLLVCFSKVEMDLVRSGCLVVGLSSRDRGGGAEFLLSDLRISYLLPLGREIGSNVWDVRDSFPSVAFRSL